MKHSQILGTGLAAALLLVACPMAGLSAANARAAGGWTERQVLWSGRLSHLADTMDRGSIAVCDALREMIVAVAGHPVNQCAAVALSFDRRGRRSTVYDLFVLTEAGDDDGVPSTPLWDSFTAASSGPASYCGRYRVFVYRRGSREIDVLGEPVEERSC